MKIALEIVNEIKRGAFLESEVGEMVTFFLQDILRTLKNYLVMRAHRLSFGIPSPNILTLTLILSNRLMTVGW